MTAESRVAVLSGPRKFDLVERARPVPREGEALIRIAATAVCHTDLDMYTGSNKSVRYPVVLGHESTGTVEAVASEGSGLDAGADGAHQSRHHVRPLRLVPARARTPVPQCRSLRPRDRRIAQRIRDARHALPLCAAAANFRSTMRRIVETLATVRHAQERAQLQAGESVVVLGQGTSGLLHTRLAVLTGCDPVIAVSRTKWKLERAMSMGARHAVQLDAKDAVQEVLRLTNGSRRRCRDRHGRRSRHDARRHRHAAPRRPFLLVLAEPRAVCRRERVSALLQGSEHHRLAGTHGGGHQGVHRPRWRGQDRRLRIRLEHLSARGGCRSLQGIRGQSEPHIYASSSIRERTEAGSNGSDFHRQRRAAGDPRYGQALRRRRSEAPCGKARRRSRSGCRLLMGDRREGARARHPDDDALGEMGRPRHRFAHDRRW